MRAAGLAAALVLSSSLAASAGDPAARHLIYLHGRIVQEQQSARPRHPEFGYYELAQIVETFDTRGFTVPEASPPTPATIDESAAKVVDQDARSRATLSVRELVLETGLRHGFLYRPLPEWVEPVVEWSTRR